MPKKKRPIPKVDLQPYLMSDAVTIKPKDNEIRMEIGADRCRTLVMDQQTSLIMILSMIKQSKTVWGNTFMVKLLGQIEVL